MDRLPHALPGAEGEQFFSVADDPSPVARKSQPLPHAMPEAKGKQFSLADDSTPIARKRSSLPYTSPSHAQASEKKDFRVYIQGRQQVGKVTLYTVVVQEGPEERFFQKRFSDFKKLDLSLRSRPSRLVQCDPLPPSGVLGLFHRWDVGDSRNKRQRILQQYLDSLTSQVRAIRDLPELDLFFDSEAATCISWHPSHFEQRLAGRQAATSFKQLEPSDAGSLSD